MFGLFKKKEKQVWQLRQERYRYLTREENRYMNETMRFPDYMGPKMLLKKDGTDWTGPDEEDMKVWNAKSSWEQDLILQQEEDSKKYDYLRGGPRV